MAALTSALVACGCVAGHAGAAINVAAVSRQLQRATGYSASQLSTRAACGSAPAGRIRCYARVLTLAGSGGAVAPLPRPHASSAPASSAPASPAAVGAASGAPAAYTASFLQWAYDTTWLSANRGAGDTVAIVDAYGDSGAYSDMEQFRNANGLPAIPTCGGEVTTSCFEVVNQYGQTTDLPTATNDETGSWNVEESLDIDAVSSICPLCKILMVEANSDDDGRSPDLETAVSTAAALGANQISLSWGGESRPAATANESPYDSITTAAVLAAAGDSAYLGANLVEYPAALPTVTAVGGTSLTADASVARGFDESAWSRQTCSDGSTCGTESGCDTSQSTPSYQADVQTDCSGRAYNDIAADADPETGLEIYDSQPGGEGCGTASNTCIVGGTSLATPLAAAFEGVTGVADATTPAWTYSSAPLLNDIVSGSNGSCPVGEPVICTAGRGWDGPTGNGSIDGDVVSGGPGVGAQPDATNVGATSADVSASIDPNDPSAGAGTTYDWQYGPTTGYGSVTPSTALSAGTGFQSASATLTFDEPCTYHYRVVASNALGTIYGYDHTVASTMVATAPVAGTPTITGTAAIGDQLTAAPGSWSGGYACDTTYQWQRAPSPDASSWTPISGATAASYTPTASDANDYLEVVVTGSNTAGSGSASSAPTAQVPAPAGTSTTATATNTNANANTQPVTTTPTTTKPPATTAAATTTGSGSTTTTTVRFYRCARRCLRIATHGAETYTPGRADYGHYIKVVTAVTRTVGGVSSTSASTRWVGPITSPTAGDVGIGQRASVASATIVRGSSGRALAQVRVDRRLSGKLTLTVRRGTRARTQVWAYVVSAGRVLYGTSPRTLSRPLTLSFALARGQTIRLVAVRT